MEPTTEKRRKDEEEIPPRVAGWGMIASVDTRDFRIDELPSGRRRQKRAAPMKSGTALVI
jgi:hypothetical protein